MQKRKVQKTLQQPEGLKLLAPAALCNYFETRTKRSLRWAAVDHLPRTRVVVGSNPAELFSLLYPQSGMSLMQVPRGAAKLLIFSY